MDKLAEAIQSLANRIGIMMDWTSEYCSDPDEVHPGNSQVRTMIIDGKEVCPVCEGHRQSEAMSQKYKAKYDLAESRQSYNYLEKYSVLSDKSLLTADFKSYQVVEEEETENKERAVKAFQNYKKGQVFNTWLVGKPGVGKSHLAMSVLRNLNEWGEQNRRCLFVSVDEMLLRIRGSFNNKDSPYTESYFIDLLTNAEFLVLDDLGAETGGVGTEKKATDFTLRVLYAIANGRQQKPTIITSNLSIANLERMYDPKLISRLLRDTYLIKFEKITDKRIKKIDF